MKETRERERIIPEIQRMEALIAEITQEIAQTDNKIQKEEKANQEMEEAIGQMEKKKEEHKEQIESLQQDFLKERDEPNRLGKGNENLKKAVEHLKSDLDKLVADTKAVES
jgi:chromosome segregation ATPase